jgi:hypothetical protein
MLKHRNVNLITLSVYKSKWLYCELLYPVIEHSDYVQTNLSSYTTVAGGNINTNDFSMKYALKKKLLERNCIITSTFYEPTKN